MTETALRMEGVSKRFRKGEMYNSLRDLIPAITGRILRLNDTELFDTREFWALRDVSFEVRKGEAFGIIGHNGAGKSTILKILSRIMKPTLGQMTVHGRLSALIEVSAGFHQDLTGRENIYLNGVILGMSRKEIQSKLDSIVEFSGLAEFIDTPVKRYSSGMFARLGFSVAAHVEPEVLIVDEVLSVGDYLFQQKCIARMAEVIKGGTCVLFVSHNLKAVTDLCSRGLLLDHGKVAAMGEMGAVVAEYMGSMRNFSGDESDKAAQISRVVLGKGSEEGVHFESGETARLEIEAVAHRACKKVAVAIRIVDENDYRLFNTSTERLGHPAQDLNPGDTLRCAFNLDLNMVSGTFRVGVTLFQYHLDTAVDSWESAATFFVSSKAAGFRGIIDCNPVVLSQTVDRCTREHRG